MNTESMQSSIFPNYWSVGIKQQFLENSLDNNKSLPATFLSYTPLIFSFKSPAYINTFGLANGTVLPRDFVNASCFLSPFERQTINHTLSPWSHWRHGWRRWWTLWDFYILLSYTQMCECSCEWICSCFCISTTCFSQVMYSVVFMGVGV